MPIQEEAISGRPELGIEGQSSISGLSPTLGAQVGEWQKYYGDERKLFQKYQQGFAKALQAETERWQPIATEISGQLDKFWNVRRRYDEELWRYRNQDRSRRRRRRMRGVMEDLRLQSMPIMEDIQETFARLDYRPPTWTPPELGKEPEIRTEAELQTPSRGGSQRYATGVRPRMETDFGNEVISNVPRFKRQAGQVKTAGLAMREREAAVYNRLLRENADIYRNLRSSIGTQVERVKTQGWPY